MDKKFLYLAGPMTGYPNYNYDAFNKVAKILQEQGHKVFNPAELEHPDRRRADFLRLDLQWILHNATGIRLLPGWQKSRGALLEVFVALELGMRDIYELDLEGEAVRRVGYSDLPLPRELLYGTSAELKQIVPRPVAQAELTILEEANDLIYGDRQAQYTHPIDNFAKIGTLMGATLAAAGFVPAGTVLDPATVGWLMVDLKKGRDYSSPGKRDTLVDAAGYVGTVAMVREEEARRRVN